MNGGGVNNWLAGNYKPLFDGLLGFFGQLMVVMFLVYSGYGIMESFKRKRKRYLDDFLKKRVLKTLVHFDLAVILFMIGAIILGHSYSAKEYILSLTGWLSVGNSNWFIFDIIILYLLSYITLTIVERRGLNEKATLWIIYSLSVAFLIIMFFAKKGQFWWFDTILAFPTGMLWSVYREKLETEFSIQRKWLLAFFTVAILFAGFYIGGNSYKAIFSFAAAPLFGILVVITTMRIKIGNKVLNWLGLNAFSIYILQRLSMIIAAEYNLNEVPTLFLLIVIPSTLLIAAIFTAFTDRIDRKIFS